MSDHDSFGVQGRVSLEGLIAERDAAVEREQAALRENSVLVARAEQLKQQRDAAEAGQRVSSEVGKKWQDRADKAEARVAALESDYDALDKEAARWESRVAALEQAGDALADFAGRDGHTYEVVEAWCALRGQAT